VSRYKRRSLLAAQMFLHQIEHPSSIFLYYSPSAKIKMNLELLPSSSTSLTPVIVQKTQDSLTIQKFVAVPRKTFCCRIRLKRLPPEGVLYGCRMYIDKGGLDSYHVVNLNNLECITNSSNLSTDKDHFSKNAYIVGGH